MRIISVFNQKGGVGKTTTVVNLAVALKRLDKKVLVIDIDPQANTTTGLGLDKYKVDNSLYELFYANEENASNIDEDLENSNLENPSSTKDNDDESKTSKDLEEKSEDDDNKIVDNTEINLEEYISHTKSGVDLIASESALSGLEVELVELDAFDRTQQLKNILSNLTDDQYDYVLIDCPPSLGLLSINALVASSSIIIPIQTEYYALEGVIELMNTYNMVKKQLNKDLEIEGVLLSMFDKRADLSYEVVEEVKSYFKNKVFKFMIPRNSRLAEAPSHGLSTIEYDEKSAGAIAYLALAGEIIKKESEVVNDK
jgi:chromosome partitioning protein transcriptional regulator